MSQLSINKLKKILKGYAVDKPLQKSLTLQGKRIKICYKISGDRLRVLNADMIRDRNLSLDQIKEIISLAKKKDRIFDLMRKTNDPDDLQTYANLVTQVEYQLQTAWGFRKNKNFHRFWELPKCQCPRMDNEEMWGLSYSIISGACPIHGKSFMAEIDRPFTKEAR